ncbi:sulfotransferase domain-containing protein [Helicobacter mesocricetorum]|uniref:sulfotransferase domain-containing protein n=1 Tax=Helicobacter mesocricetorum TaxID=87012 RepID=UPI000CF07150|nr:sulfotransferase domain-containing protein [Helicobacter mesocricetorum]
MKYLFIDSMSRTGTSLLYQLLFGHKEIYFAPFRIQFVCSKPFGFPLNATRVDKETFFNTLMHKTTIIDKKGSWPDITTETLAKLFPHKLDVKNLILGDNPLESAIKTIHHILDLEFPTKQTYYCLHDDHSYMLGSEAFLQYDCKILSTLRNPIDMIASKKNMLVMYVYGQKNPHHFLLKKQALSNEALRAVFSWWVASYEREKKHCIIFSMLKNKQTRPKEMQKVAKYLNIAYDSVLESEAVEMDKKGYYNELLANGSSLSTIEYLSKGVVKQQISNKGDSLTLEELKYLHEILPEAEFLSLDSWKALQDVRLESWIQAYQTKKTEELFMQYSALNYGRINAKEAFVELFGGGGGFCSYRLVLVASCEYAHKECA